MSITLSWFIVGGIVALVHTVACVFSDEDSTFIDYILFLAYIICGYLSGAIMICSFVFLYLFSNEEKVIKDLWKDVGAKTELMSKKRIGKWQNRRDR